MSMPNLDGSLADRTVRNVAARLVPPCHQLRKLWVTVPRKKLDRIGRHDLGP
jgi:hypothetical protein